MALRYRGELRWLRSHPVLGDGDGQTFGCALIPGPCNRYLTVVFADSQDPVAEGWEHVSVSMVKHTPNWQEMCFIKDLFWDGEDTVIQFHPPKSSYVNNHPHCLHLWRPASVAVSLPPLLCV